MKVNEEILVIYWDINEMLFCEEQKVMESLKEHAAAVREPLNISPMNIDGRMAGHRVEGTASLWQKIYTSPQLHRSAPSINSDPLPSISSFHRPMILEIDWMDEQTNVSGLQGIECSWKGDDGRRRRWKDGGSCSVCKGHQRTTKEEEQLRLFQRSSNARWETMGGDLRGVRRFSCRNWTENYLYESSLRTL